MKVAQFYGMNLCNDFSTSFPPIHAKKPPDLNAGRLLCNVIKQILLNFVDQKINNTESWYIKIGYLELYICNIYRFFRTELMLSILSESPYFLAKLPLLVKIAV